MIQSHSLPPQLLRRKNIPIFKLQIITVAQLMHGDSGIQDLAGSDWVPHIRILLPPTFGDVMIDSEQCMTNKSTTCHPCKLNEQASIGICSGHTSQLGCIWIYVGLSRSSRALSDHDALVPGFVTGLLGLEARPGRGAVLGGCEPRCRLRQGFQRPVISARGS